MTNYYEILGISKEANLAEIKTAYRKLSKKFHPDVNEGDPFFENMFLKIQTAYEVLSEAKRRRRYDALLNHFHQSAKPNISSTAFPKILNFSVDKTEIKQGEVFTLSWRVENADSVEIKPFGTFATEGIDHFKFNPLVSPYVNLVIIATDTNTGASAREVLTLYHTSYQVNGFNSLYKENGKGIFLIKVLILLLIAAFILAILIVGVEVKPPLENYQTP